MEILGTGYVSDVSSAVDGWHIHKMFVYMSEKKVVKGQVGPFE